MNYWHLHNIGRDEEYTMLLFDEDNEMVETLGDANDEEYIFLTEQMNWKQGLKLFAEKGEDAISKELKQVHDMEGFEPKHWYNLTSKQQSKALRYLMYLKEKRCGKIKARGIADGRKQRIYITKEEANSPTVSIAGLMLTCVIDAFEERDVATVDIRRISSNTTA